MALQSLFRRQCSRPVFGSKPAVRSASAVVARSHHGRRELLQLGIALPFLASRPAFADVAEAPEAPAVEAPAAAAAPAAVAPAPASPVAGKGPEPFLEVEFQLVPPSSFNFVDTQPLYDPNRRGPAPEPSPVKARFDSQDGSTVLSVVVTDISVFGGLEETAKLLLPRGSKVLAASELQVVLPPKQTALGPVELPPKRYYRYEFTTNNGLHVVMTVAAQKGKVYVCGGSTAAGLWEQYGAALRAATESFRLRSEGMLL
ncbi:hypothetical protein GPECTOR_13g640 [Gonium pectorale]|uniref:Uncharacterized protein n=1 Tax=Gonium pectorale TaxID=33097 RepID=A0A150GMT3_GONPE|nr:hypothetical protein GPECTOR_13g640 [Gonium pectorale]|eukprot:KXZ51153.1 hypothetical protein GPECTOR_13g640 [Gonium pectorale]